MTRSTGTLAVASALWYRAPLALLQYSLAMIGPVLLAGAQFALSLVLLHLLGQDGFGAFSFLLVVSQFLMGLSGAFLCAPLAVLVAQSAGGMDSALVRSLFATNLLFSIFTGSAVFALDLAVGGGSADAALFGSYAGVTMLRWFCRAHAYATRRPMRAVVSDIISAVALAAGIGLIAWVTVSSATIAYLFLLVSALVGLVPFGARDLGMQFQRPRQVDLARYGEIWKRHSSWSLLGLVTTEATGNAHAYLVTLVSGAAAFAALAASALLIRPSTILMNALGEFERPRLARQISQRRYQDVRHTVALFRIVLCAGWLATAAAATVILFAAPHVVFPKEYQQGHLALAAALWIVIMGMRLARTPESALLQAAGQFRPLALSSLRSASVSVIAVPVALLTGGPLFSLAGVLVGEMAFTFTMWRVARRWWRSVEELQ